MSRVSFGLSALALCAATPALSDVTAAELWAEWQEQSVAQGQTLSADAVLETATGLTLQGVTSVFDDEDVRTTARTDEMVLTENGDGTVTVTMSELYDITIEIENEGNPPASIGLELRHEGLSILAGGTVDARSYDYSADTITVTEGELSGGPGAPPAVDLLVTLRDLDAGYLIDGSDPDDLVIDSRGTIASMSGGIDVVAAPGDQGRLKASFMLSGLTSTGNGQMGSLAALDAEGDALPEGFDVAAELAYDAGWMNIDFDDEMGTAFRVAYTNEGTSLSMAITADQFAVDYTETGTAMEMSGTDLPVPISVSYASGQVAMDIPITGGDVAVPFAARVAYEEIAIDEALWAMVDPGRAIARDPLTVIADMSGTVQMMTNLMEMKPDEIDAPPGELRSLTLNELRISGGGAELTGTGDMSFAAGQVIPMPVGNVELSMTGGNALMDSLVATGMVPADQVMMVRAMTGMFARPGPTPDSLESVIEFGADGTITANGIPFQ